MVVLTEGEYKGHTVAPPTSSSCTHSCCTLSHTLSTASIVCSCLCHFCRSSAKETAATVPARDWREVLCVCVCVVCVCGVCGVCVVCDVCVCVQTLHRFFFCSLHMTLCYADSLRVTHSLIAQNLLGGYPVSQISQQCCRAGEFPSVSPLPGGFPLIPRRQSGTRLS